MTENNQSRTRYLFGVPDAKVITEFGPPNVPPRRDVYIEGECPECGRFLFGLKSEVRHHRSLHAKQRELMLHFPGIIANYYDRENVKNDFPRDPCDPQQVLRYCLGVAWSHFSRSVYETHLRIEPNRLVCLGARTRHVSWPDWLSAYLQTDTKNSLYFRSDLEKLAIAYLVECAALVWREK